MKNVNFATRVRVKMIPKETENGAYLSKRKEIQEEINHPRTKVNLDRSCYQKTEWERQQVKQAKQEWKINQK